MQHGAAHGYAVVAFEQRWGVGEQCRYGLTSAYTGKRERGGKAARARVELGVTAPSRTVDDGGVLRVNIRRALEKAQRRQRLIVGWVAVETGVVGVCGHAHLCISPHRRALVDKGADAFSSVLGEHILNHDICSVAVSVR